MLQSPHFFLSVISGETSENLYKYILERATSKYAINVIKETQRLQLCLLCDKVFHTFLYLDTMDYNILYQYFIKFLQH